MPIDQFQAIPEKLEFVFSNSWMSPADVQRDFQWSEIQVGDLLADLIAHYHRINAPRQNDPAADMGDDYFMGVLIVHGEAQRFRVFDGLQRLTTLTILICILRDLIKDDLLSARLNACVVDRKGAPRLALSGQPYLQTQIQPPGRALNLAPGVATGQRASLRAAQKLLRDGLSGYKQPFLEGLASVVLDHVVLLQLRVQSEAVANIIFKTLNMRGLKLEEADLIKSRLAEFASTDAEAADLLARWQTIRQALNSKSQLRTDGEPEDSAHFDRYRGFQGFVLALEMMERMDPPWRQRRPSPAARVDAYVDWLKERYTNASGLTGYFAFLKRCADNWNLLNQPGLGGITSPFHPLLPIRAVRWTEWKPLVLRIMGLSVTMKTAGPAWRDGLFDQIHRAAIAMQLADFNADKRALVFAKALRELCDVDAPPTKLHALDMHPADVKRIHDALTAPFTDHTIRRSLVLWTEYIMAGDERRYMHRVSVEHVLPVSTTPPQDWLDAFPDWQQRRALVHLLGNLAIIPQDLNPELGDAGFTEKLAHISAHSGDLSGFQLLSWVRGQEEWTPAEIEARTKALATRIWDELAISPQGYDTYSEDRD